MENTDNENIIQFSPNTPQPTVNDSVEEIIVLDPDHPLLERFQKSLQAHIKSQLERVSTELWENQEELKRKKVGRENIALDLYRLQQELARKQVEIEKVHVEMNELNETECNAQELLGRLKISFKEKLKLEKSELDNVNTLQTQVESNDMKVFYLDLATTDLRSDIKIMRRATDKVTNDVDEVEIKKRNQDLYIDRIVKQINLLNEKNAVLETQIKAQQDLILENATFLTEANIEMETLNIDKKQVYQQWNNSLLGMKRRDNTLSLIVLSLNESRKVEKSYETEINYFTTAIKGEQNTNEKLTSILHNIECVEEKTKKNIEQCKTKFNVAVSDYSVYNNLLDKTETNLSQCAAEIKEKEKVLESLRKKIEIISNDKIKIEDDIHETLQNQFTTNKSYQYTTIQISKNNKLRREIEKRIAIVDNEIAKIDLNISEYESAQNQLNAKFEEYEKDLKKKTAILEKGVNKITQNNTLIERKQSNVDIYNKKLESLISKSDGCEIGPLEIEIHSLQKSIDEEDDEIDSLEQNWLRNQVELVLLYEHKQEISVKNENLRKQLIILERHKQRIENNIEAALKKGEKFLRTSRETRHKINSLNDGLSKNSSICNTLERGNILIESDFVAELRQEEKVSFEMQTKLSNLREMKESIVEYIVEAERQIMLWEKKTRLMKETRDTIDSDVGKGELHAMKADIHRMQVKLSSLSRKQEEFCKQLEKSVSRRDAIANRGAIQVAKLGNANYANPHSPQTVTFAQHNHKLTLTKRKIKEIITKISQSDYDMEECTKNENTVIEKLEDLESKLNNLNSNLCNVDNDVYNYTKQVNYKFSMLLLRQQSVKWYQRVISKNYKLIFANKDIVNQKNSNLTSLFAKITTLLNLSMEIGSSAYHDVKLIIDCIKI
ncbi:Coiled-coil domain-containing protein 40 [Intoshia linei]|uniref:Coiled-coil domain-containing protein 40 n=1 Tax=Intoshia linei TaxID=1819745 RepID=A0A177AWA6_9BILA|nr:Coiled-coil domain-containing protein 40 [Intoshia linei]